MNTFEGSRNINRDDNKVLRIFAKMWKEYGTGYWPSVVINKRTFRGDLNPDNVYSAICAGFHTVPKACGGTADEHGALLSGEREGISGNALIAVVVILVLVNLFLIILYRRCTNKEIKEDMQL